MYNGEMGTIIRNYLSSVDGIEKTYTSLNHEEYKIKDLPGYIWICHWESKSEKFGVPESGWCVYQKKDLEFIKQVEIYTNQLI